MNTICQLEIPEIYILESLSLHSPLRAKLSLQCTWPCTHMQCKASAASALMKTTKPFHFRLIFYLNVECMPFLKITGTVLEYLAHFECNLNRK